MHTGTQHAHLIAQLEKPGGYGGQCCEGRGGVQSRTDHLPQCGPHLCRFPQALGGEGEDAASLSDAARVGRCKFPILQFAEGDFQRIKGVLHIVCLR